MKKETTPLRLIYPQWQGGIVDHWMPDITVEDSSRGYYLGAQLLNLLAPDSNQKTVEVPVSLDINDRATEKGINSRNVIVKQSKAALDILNENNRTGSSSWAENVRSALFRSLIWLPDTRTM